MNDELSQSPIQDATPVGPILAAAGARRRAATASGHLQAIRTALDWVEDGGFRFPVRWVDRLARKPRPPRQLAGANPFLPWEPALEVGPAGPDHVILLNKYPVMDGHLLVITRQFVPQEAPLDAGDVGAMLPLLDEAGGLAFYNGGRIAGASQPHRHLQWIPRDDVNRLPLLAAIEESVGDGLGACARLPFRHAIAAMPDGALGQRPERILRCYLALCERTGRLGPAGELRPYNLLMTTRAMLVVPRERESVEGISINSLGFAGSLFVPQPAMIDRIRQRGPLALLAAASGGLSGGSGPRRGK